MIFDAHAHIYPDAIALKAAHSIAEFYDIPVLCDGTGPDCGRIFDADLYP